MSRAGHVRRVGFVLACGLLSVSCTSDPATTTTTTVTSTTTTTSTTSTSIPDTTTTVSESQRLSEVTEIVREVDFTFFSAIFQKDEQMLADALAVQDRYENGLELMEDENYFTEEPTREGIIIEVQEVLIDREDCLAVSYHGDATVFRGPDAQGEFITVYWPRPSDARWRRAYRGDEWQDACDAFIREGQVP